jgi:hypothetical protein
MLIPCLVSAQNYRRECYLSDQARYDCFIQSQTGTLEAAKTSAADKAQILTEQAAARPDLYAERQQRREIELQELRQIVEEARSRNVSNEGRRYQVNYGIVLEPRQSAEE